MLLVGSVFFRMANRYKSNSWTIFVLGLATFYGGIIIFEISFEFIMFLKPDLALAPNFSKFQSLISIPFAILASFITYSILEVQLKSSFIQKSRSLVGKFGGRGH